LPHGRRQPDDGPVRAERVLIVGVLLATVNDPRLGLGGATAATVDRPTANPQAPAFGLRTTPIASGPRLDGSVVRQHATEIADYTMRATLDPDAHTVHGEGTIRWRNASTQPVGELWIHLYLNAFKNQHSAFLRERTGGRGSQGPEDWGFIDLRRLSLVDRTGAAVDLLADIELRRPGDDDETDARVPLPRTIGPGEWIDLEMAFDDKLPSIVERTGYHGHFHMVGQWFPKIARLEPDGSWAHFPFHHLSEFFADFGIYDVTIDVPASYTIGATGPIVESRVEHGRRIERHRQGDIHDFAWTAWDAWQSVSDRIDGVDVRILYPPGFTAVAERDLEAVRFALPYDAANYGRYPYSVLTVVHTEEQASEAGGMEYPTLITTESPWLTPNGVYVPEIVTVHELGHQWFYGLVATNEAMWPFLDEGINQYAEADTMAAWRGEGSAVDLLGLCVSDMALQAVSGERAVHDEPVAQAAASFSSGANYARLVYSRTASVIATFARVYGQSAVRRALGIYARRYRFEHPGPEQFLAVFAEVLGADVAGTVRSALSDRGWVDFGGDGVWSRRAQSAGGVWDRDGKRQTSAAHDEDGWEGGVIVRRRGTLVFPVDVDLVMADGTRRRETWNGNGDSVLIPWRGSSALCAAVVDPDERVVIDANIENNRAAAAGEEHFASRTLERIAYFAQIAIQAISP